MLSTAERIGMRRSAGIGTTAGRSTTGVGGGGGTSGEGGPGAGRAGSVAGLSAPAHSATARVPRGDLGAQLWTRGEVRGQSIE